MRIAVNTRFLIQGNLEGIGRYTWEVVRRMAANHPEDQFIFFFDRAFDPAFVPAHNIIPVVLFPPARHPLLFIWWFEWAVVKALKKYRIDVFLSPDNFLSLRSKVPSVLVVHDLAYLHYPEYVGGIVRWYYRFFTPRFIRKARHIIAVSAFTKQDIIHYFQKNAADISIAYNGCRELFLPLSEAEQEAFRRQKTGGMPYFLYTGAVHPRKNIHRLIAAFDLFKNNSGSGHLLLIAGRFAWQTGPVREAWEHATHRDAIQFLGYVPDEELPRLMASAVALIQISLFEGFGVPVLEAMNCDVPVIISDRSSLPEVAGEAGLQVNPESVPDIAEAIERVSRDVRLREVLTAAGREQRKQFSWDDAADIIYEKLKHLSGKL